MHSVNFDVIGGRGGLEAHPHLTMGTHYRAADNATTAQKNSAILGTSRFLNFFEWACYNYILKRAQLRHSDIILVRA